jgi:hypothetical protein
MAFTTKVANILKGAISNSISNSIGGFASGLIANQQQNSKIAAQLLNKSPLEIENINPTSHMKENPYSYGTVYYPFETSNLGEGHYIIFDVIMHNASKFKSTNFTSNKITNNEGLVGDFDTTGGTSIKQLKAQKLAANRVKGVKSGLNEKTPTHTYISDSIILYTPAPSLKFSYQANYENLETGVAGILGQSIGSFKEGKGLVDSLKAAADGMPDAAKMVGRKMAFGAASLIPGFENAEAAYDKAKGQAVNPQMETIFKSVPFRTFEFPFEFAPKNTKEKDDIHKIINMFKFHMMPEYQGTTKGFFNVPSEFQITYMYRENRNTYIPRISRCVLTNMNVDYAPEGVFTTFIADPQGAPPTLATMSLSFTETEIMTKERIAEGY